MLRMQRRYLDPWTRRHSEVVSRVYSDLFVILASVYHVHIDSNVLYLHFSDRNLKDLS